jgi:hypothetical protein
VTTAAMCGTGPPAEFGGLAQMYAAVVRWVREDLADLRANAAAATLGTHAELTLDIVGDAVWLEVRSLSRQSSARRQAGYAMPAIGGRVHRRLAGRECAAPCGEPADLQDVRHARCVPPVLHALDAVRCRARGDIRKRGCCACAAQPALRTHSVLLSIRRTSAKLHPIPRCPPTRSLARTHARTHTHTRTHTQ